MIARAGPPGERGAFARFFRSEASGSVLLLVAAVVALGWANSRWAESYERMLHLPFGVSREGVTYALSLQHWVNDGLMALFFFVVGLEIKREMVVGQLSTLRGAVLPVAAALGGVVLPAGIYAALNAGGPGGRGWGIPMATDIAFALGVLALLGPRVPVGLKVFLTALAIADDLAAVLVIAFFYTEKIHLLPLATDVVLYALLVLAARLSVRSAAVYAVLACGVWIATLSSGIHATVAGVLVALVVPVRARIEPGEFLSVVRGRLAELEASDLSRESMVRDRRQMELIGDLHQAAGSFLPPALALETALHPVTAYVVLPLFALFNAGVKLEGGIGPGLASPVSLGVLLGLFAGKQVGITLASWLAVRLGATDLPEGVTLLEIYGAAVLGGIGFTMSIFIGSLAFPDPALLGAAKLGILAASALAGVSGYLLLRLVLRRSG